MVFEEPVVVLKCFLPCLRLFSQPCRMASEVFNVAHSIKVVKGGSTRGGNKSHIGIILPC